MADDDGFGYVGLESRWGDDRKNDMCFLNSYEESSRRSLDWDQGFVVTAPELMEEITQSPRLAYTTTNKVL